uniref:Ycf54-like protein n=1 Tax=Lotus japonicus TaxID=34305 RepID=I3SDP8_LOTJA|nr:unknown [Lotus japonicus]
MMLGVATLTLGPSTAMAAQSQAQHPTTLASVNALTGVKRHSLSYRTHSLPMNLVSPTNQNVTLFSSFKEPTPAAAPFTTAVAAVDSDNLSSSDPATKKEANKYYFVIANAKFMLDEEEHFREVLFERLRLFEERKVEQDFWLVIEPKFLDRFPGITKRLGRPAVALVSTNGPWITYMKLRLDRVLSESFEAESIEEALASNPTNLDFGKPDKWVAPYPKYESGWWETFLLPAQKEV